MPEPRQRFRATRVRAALHETRCQQCRVTWLSWAQRLLGIRAGFSPKAQHEEVIRLQKERDRYRRLLERAYWPLKEDDERRKGMTWLLVNDIYEALEGDVKRFRSALPEELGR